MAVLKMKSRKQWIGSKELEFYKIKIIMLMNAVDIVVHEPPKIMKNKLEIYSYNGMWHDNRGLVLLFSRW